ncbi:MAG: GH32 C-terminal domain-containing protein [Corynebacterium sp.]|nr:GH32 C-terminal domain-containing protein [Corynebacterium sp.]
MDDLHARNKSKAMVSRHELELRLDKTWYPEFHLAAPAGILRQITGLVLFDTNVQIYYEHVPGNAEEGISVWGHATTHNFIDFEQQPIVLVPHERADSQGVCGGCVVGANDGSLWAFYTAQDFKDPANPEAGYSESQHVASSTDGQNFSKLMQVIAPSQASSMNSPKVWKQDHEWFMILGGAKLDPIHPEQPGSGVIWLYRAQEATGPWFAQGILFEDQDESVVSIESPDLFYLDDHWVLSYTPVRKEPSGLINRNLHQSGYVVGQWDPATGFTPETEYRVTDHGHNFARMQSVRFEGRRVALGWMGTDHSQPSVKQAWAGQLSIARELRLDDSLRLRQSPVLKKRAMRYMEFSMVDEQRFELVNSPVYQISIKKETFRGDRFVMEVHASGEACTRIIWDAATNLVSLDRGATPHGERSVRHVALDPSRPKVDLQIIVDRCSVEVFVDDGEFVLSSLSFPYEDVSPNRITVEGGEGRVTVTT